MTEQEHPLDYAAAYFDQNDDWYTAAVLRSSSLSVWEEPREELAVLDATWPDAYSDVYAELSVPFGGCPTVEEHEEQVQELLRQSVYFEYFRVTEEDPTEDDLPLEDATPAAPKHAAAIPCEWKGHGLRSTAERKIAEALDEVDGPMLFFADRKCRLGLTPESRLNREPDFFVVYRGRMGILEVDGNNAHDGRAAEDHERDRFFEHHGVRTWRFTAERCYQDPQGVVDEFLTLLARS